MSGLDVKRKRGGQPGNKSRWRPNKEKFYSLVDKQDFHWFWKGKLRPDGYGAFWDNEDQKDKLAHVYSYEIHVGPIPSGSVLHHWCGIRH